MTSQMEKAEAFRALHEASGAFLIPNPWDIGSARLLEGMGFAALATTSSGFAQSIGRWDGMVSLHEKVKHCRELAEATTVPISADLENGFADDPEGVAECIARIAETGVVGGSIEDYTGDAERPIYDFDLALERVAAAAEAASGLPFPFTLTARCENFLRAERDIDDTIRRLQAYAAAGADAVYAPGISTLDEVQAIASAVDKPQNVLASSFKAHTLNELEAAGAKRVSTGGALLGVSLTPFLLAGRRMQEGRLDWMGDVASGNRLRKLLQRWLP